MTEPHDEQVELGSLNFTHGTEDAVYAPQRVTWTCSCGAELYDDYVERVPGSLHVLRVMLRAPPPSSSYVEIQRNVRNSMQRLFKSLTRSLSPSAMAVDDNNPSSEHSGIPTSPVRGTDSSQPDPPDDGQQDQHKSPAANSSSASTTISSVPVAPSSPQLDPFVSYLLLCIPEGLSGLKLHNQQILRPATRSRLANHVINDKELFRLLRKTYASERKVVLSWLWPKTVIRVSLAYFLVDFPGYVELKHYSCQGIDADCRCLPPKALLHPSSDAQYHCSPQDPPFKPPIGANYLTHYFQNDCIQSDQMDFVLNQIPKRLGQCMVASGRSRLEAWGLEFKEGWDRGRLRNALFAIVVFGSFLFAVLWSTVAKDMSSAFETAGFAVAVLTLVGGYVASAEPRVVHQ